MKRIAIMTSFANFSPDYSLVSVVADQLRMLTEHQYQPILIVQQDFRADAAVPAGVEIRKLLPTLPLHDYQIGEDAKPDFANQVACIRASLTPLLGLLDIVITHDLIFLGWYLPHNAAIRQLAEEYPRLKWLHWIHSAPSIRPTNLKYPHTLRFTLPPHSKLVYLNNSDTQQLARMYGTTLDAVRVVHNSRDPEVFFDFHPLVLKIIDRYPVLFADVVAIYPFSTPRHEGKNVKKLIGLVAKIKEHGQEVCLVLVNAHCNAQREKETVHRLLTYAFTQGLTASDICFTSMLANDWEYSVPNAAIRQLFQLSNVFILPSLSEGCSLILLGAALCKNLLVLNKDVPSLREFGGEHALYPRFGNVQHPFTHADENAYWSEWARTIVDSLQQERALTSFRHILRHHQPAWIFRHQLAPLIDEPWE